MNNEIIKPIEAIGAIAGEVECRERLGGTLEYFHRVAASFFGGAASFALAIRLIGADHRER